MRRTTIAAIPVLVLAAALVAGPLDPPAGPVTSTYKTLTEVEPRIAISSTNTPGDVDSVYRITQPGSYYLTGNITGVAGKRCIEIASDDVTIDLNGMIIWGDASSTGGVYADGIRNNIVVRNGSIRSVGAGPGLGYSIATSNGWRVENLSAFNNNGAGLDVPGGSIIQFCRSMGNGGPGIKANTYSQVVECVCEQNQDAGVDVRNGSLVSKTVCRSNASDGIDAAGDGVRIQDCVITSNTGNGIVLLNGCSVTGCVVRSNSLIGIVTASACTVEHNDVTFSGGHGISITGNCIVRQNASHANGVSTPGAGIFCASARTRIEENNCNDNDYGIRVTVSPNFISRNIAGGNGTLNWDISSGNRCLVVQGVSAPAISGNSGGLSAGSTDPNANFTN